jgi:glycosyltransferase involved in cell wall biosynthesis
MGVLVPLAARRSDRVIVPSANTRDDLVRLLRVPPAKIDVVPLGVAMPSGQASDEAEFRARLRLQDRAVVLTASAKRPHKNLLRLLDAWVLIPPESRPILVLPGYPTHHEAQLRDRAARLGLQADTRFIGWIARDELDDLYAMASCFVFPSLYEGFGLPVLEAMARGVPVACSNRGSLAEVAGQAALTFDPESEHAIATAVREILGDPATASRLRAAGYEQARKFSWSATARATLRTYERVLGTAS